MNEPSTISVRILRITAQWCFLFWVIGIGTVHNCSAVSSPECTGCLTCVSSCPQQNVLAMRPVFWNSSKPVWVYPVIAVSIFMVAVGVGMAGGHWQSSLSYADYQRLIPFVQNLSH